MEWSIIHFGDIVGWHHFEQEDSFVIYQVNYHRLDETTFFPYHNVDQNRLPEAVAIFKVARKWTNMMIADNIIETALKNFAV